MARRKKRANRPPDKIDKAAPGPRQHQLAACLPQATAPALAWQSAAAGLIALAALAAYANSFQGAFVFDDPGSIVNNQTIHKLWPLTNVLSPPGTGQTVSGRPLLNLSLALNYAVSGTSTWSYHATNLALHIAAALVLLGIARRTLLIGMGEEGGTRKGEGGRQKALAEPVAPVLPSAFSLHPSPGHALWLACAVALLWVVHPTHTESVTYIVQRAESLAGLLYLLTLYCFIRGATAAADTEKGTGTSRRVEPACLSPRPASRASRAAFWYSMAVATCLLGMAAKEIMVTAPLVVLLYDRAFLTGSFREAWRRRWRFYAALAATWIALVYLVLGRGDLGRTSSFPTPGVWAYARTQPGVILHYLRVCFWPHPLCADYRWPVAQSLGDALPGALVVGAIAAMTLWGVVANKAWGFLGACFFLVLAPTSSVLALPDLAFDHRMYLPLAAVATMAVASGYFVCGKAVSCGLLRPLAARALGGCAAATVAIAFIVLTHQRNPVYNSDFSLWKDTVAKAPGNPRAHNNFAIVLERAGRVAEALEHYRQALKLAPKYPNAHDNLGTTLCQQGHREEGISHFRAAVEIDPGFADAHYHLGMALHLRGDADGAATEYRKALDADPQHAAAHAELGAALAEKGRINEAIEHFQASLQVDPRNAPTHRNLALALQSQGKLDEAMEHLQQAVANGPQYALARLDLALALLRKGRIDEAIGQYQRALEVDPGNAAAHNNLGNLLSAQGRTEEAIAQYRDAVRLNPSFALTHNNLAGLLAGMGRLDEAVHHYREATGLLPDHPQILRNFAWLRATAPQAGCRNGAEAVIMAQKAYKLAGGSDPAYLDTLAAAYAEAGRFPDAIKTAREGEALAMQRGASALAKSIHKRLELYRNLKAARE
jgi:protein O-mannosyl-transferase